MGRGTARCGTGGEGKGVWGGARFGRGRSRHGQRERVERALVWAGPRAGGPVWAGGRGRAWGKPASPRAVWSMRTTPWKETWPITSSGGSVLVACATDRLAPSRSLGRMGRLHHHIFLESSRKMWSRKMSSRKMWTHGGCAAGTEEYEDAGVSYDSISIFALKRASIRKVSPLVSVDLCNAVTM